MVSSGSVNDRVILITGASRGIGAATALLVRLFENL
jgi:NAD(P)-dependent dehydrogenase (short-subunit alcohol dehydrogenase family)